MLRVLEDIWTRRVVVYETKKRKFIVGVVCDQSFNMVAQEPLSPDVRVFMTEEEALFYEWECGDSQ